MITANFSAYGKYTVDSLHQWDINQKLELPGLNLATAPEVHFYNASMGGAIVRQAEIVNNVVVVDIPNSLLQQPLKITAKIGIHSGGAFAVVETVEIPVKPGKRPEDYQLEDTDGELYSFKALQNQINNAATNARVDNIIAANNSTNGNAELVDIRSGIDGKIYGSAGAAVRGQVTELNEVCKKDGEYLVAALNGPEMVVNPALVAGFVRYTDGTLSNDGFDGMYCRTGYIQLPNVNMLAAIDLTTVFAGSSGYAFYAANKAYISGGAEKEITTIPAEARYIAFTSYSLAGDHAGVCMTVKFAAFGYGKKYDIARMVSYGDSHVARGLWQQRVIDRFGVANHVNLGLGSASMAETTETDVKPCVHADRIAAIKAANPDLVIIRAGTNDSHYDVPLGDAGEITKSLATKNKATFYGAYSYLLETLLSWRPALKILICTVPRGQYGQYHTPDYNAINAAIYAIGRAYGIPICDIWEKCGISDINLATYSDDQIHYNQNGEDRVASLIISCIDRSYIGG